MCRRVSALVQICDPIFFNNQLFPFQYLKCIVIWFLLICIHHGTGENTFEDSVQKCVNQKDRTNIVLPLEMVEDKGALELWFYYNGKYDLYLTYNNGHIYHQELQLNEKITPRLGADRANCSK